MLTDDFCDIPQSLHTNVMTALKTAVHVGDAASHYVMCHTQEL
jgi:hypothetical protein